MKSKLGVIVMHSDSDYSAFPMCREMAKRGYTVLGSHVRAESVTLDEKLLDVHTAVSFMRNYPEIEKIILMGHSGGATLLSAYKAIAENGPKIFRGEQMLFSCTLKEPLTDADGIMLIDSNWGNGAMTLFSIDPAVIEEGNGIKLNQEFDIYSPENGYSPDGANYSDIFLNKYFHAQKARNNALVEKAAERLHALEKGKGLYNDDEPFIIAGGALSLPCNKLFPQDLHLFAHTKEKYTLLHKNGEKTFETVYSVRRPERFGNNTPVNREGTLITTVRQFLSERGVTAGENYHISAEGVTGVQWDRSYNCTPANVRHIHAPILCMGMTGSHEFLAAEEIYRNAGSQDKEIAFVEGANHMFRTINEKYGDTEQIVYDYADQWLSMPGRFLD
ncbi:MAG: alpha/beta hydrolase [Ruminiclostridium sp.]